MKCVSIGIHAKNYLLYLPLKFKVESCDTGIKQLVSCAIIKII